MSKEIFVPEPLGYDQEMVAFHEKYCGNQRYMMEAMYREPAVWNSYDCIQQLVHLQARGAANKHILKRLIKRYHRLIGDAGVEAVMEG